MCLESPAAYESDQQRFQRELDSEAWSTNTGKEQAATAFPVSIQRLLSHLPP